MRTKFVLAAVLLTCISPLISEGAIQTNLKYGDRGDAVWDLQQFLIENNFLTGQATGSFYAMTRNAVKAFQKSVNLPQTGYVGPQTRAAINGSAGISVQSTATTSTASDPALNGLTKQIQGLLQQISSIQGVATSSIAQTYATSTSQSAFDPKWRDSVVNLFCTSRYAGYEGLSSGTGIIIDPRGVILTNSHVAEEFLYSNWPNPSLNLCSVRVGSPANPQYDARILYMPNEWMQESLVSAFAGNATTTYGRKDYALLLITGPKSSEVKMPTAFPYLRLYQGNTLPVNTPVYLMGYAAENMGMEMMLRDLYLMTTSAKVNAQRGIGDGSVADVVAFSGPIISQHGASGGGVITQGGEIAGILTFLDGGFGEMTNQRVLNAITSSYILRDFAAENGMSLATFLSTLDLTGIAQKFDDEKAAPFHASYVKMVKERGYYIPGTE